MRYDTPISQSTIYSRSTPKGTQKHGQPPQPLRVFVFELKLNGYNERINEYVPDVRFERTSIMGAMGLNGIIAPLTYKGTLNGEFFGVYVKECLAPAMKAGDTIMLDNLSAHKVENALKPLYDKGINVVFLPPYSHDFNPIEQAWSKIKAYLRKIKARTYDELFCAMGCALALVTFEDIKGWVLNCGYGL